MVDNGESSVGGRRHNLLDRLGIEPDVTIASLGELQGLLEGR